MASNELTLRDEITDLNCPSEALELANTLAKVIVAKGLAVSLPKAKKQYVTVEGWQLAGAMCGIYPLVEKVEDLSNEKRICYRAEVTLRDKDNAIVGTGMAICTNQERGKESFGEYAIFSMAQTRAVGKAMRLKLGWIMKLAGFQATPSEELGADGEVIEEAEAETEPVEIDYSEELNSATNTADLYRAWLKVPKAKRPEYEALKDELKAKFAGQAEEENESD